MSDKLKEWAAASYTLLDDILGQEDEILDCCSKEKRDTFEKAIGHLYQAEHLIQILKERD